MTSQLLALCVLGLAGCAMAFVALIADWRDRRWVTPPYEPWGARFRHPDSDNE